MNKTVKCPYCGTENTIEHRRDGFYSQQHIISCYDDAGLSCDRYFVVFSDLKVETTVKEIVGESEK